MGMSVCEKILYAHALGLKEKKLEPGQVVCLAPDWILCSEASWGHMDKLYTQYGRPGFKRGDRFWLAPDHLVDPRINHLPRQRAMIEACENIATELDMKDNYNPPNTTIVHTEFYRSRCQPGMLIFGQDSHTGSSGCLGAVAIGMGAKDIFVQCLTGETYLKIPQVVNIRIVGKPKFGVTGKDVILGILKAIKRNTMCLERLVEFTGPGLEYLSCDARFTMCNMVTELGGIGSCVVADAVTKAYLEQRKDPRHKRNALYYHPDVDAQYTDSCEIDLSTIQTFVALFPSPDNVQPISEADRFALDGVFIGACTTSEEELILAALVLEQGLLEGRTPVTKGLRRVTPGSKAIVDRLNALGLLDFYERAGFVIGAPGCSYCVGLGADQAGKGEVWLSSQNRNFRDRMGPGSFANITSAAAVAASSFEMQVTDPLPLLAKVDQQRYNSMRAYPEQTDNLEAPEYIEPQPITDTTSTAESLKLLSNAPSSPKIIGGKVQRFGDNVDTDMMIPADKCFRDWWGDSAFFYYRPEFYQRAQSGFNILVAGNAFGTGSSREPAPKCLIQAGIQAVIAKSFAFIYARNQVNNGLLGITLDDDEFYELAQEGASVEIDLSGRKIMCAGQTFHFKLDPIEEQLLSAGGLLQIYEKFGPSLFRRLQLFSVDATKPVTSNGNSKMEW